MKHGQIIIYIKLITTNIYNTRYIFILFASLLEIILKILLASPKTSLLNSLVIYVFIFLT